MTADLIGGLLTDLAAERDQLLNLVESISPAQWASSTASPGWSIRDQIAHLAFFDATAALSVSDPSAFAAERERAKEEGADYDPNHLRRVPEDGPALLGDWCAAAALLDRAARAAPAGRRVPWYGPDMGLASMLSARIMEHWAHGFDVATGLGASWKPTDRLRHVAHLAVRARPYGYLVRDREPSQVAVRVELQSPSGESWVFGPDDAVESIVGTAEEFCLVLVRRRHVADTALCVNGAAAAEWLLVGQAYAGPPGVGPARLGASPGDRSFGVIH